MIQDDLQQAGHKTPVTDPGKAVLWSILLGGGQLYNGDIFKGIALIVVALICAAFGPVGFSIDIVVGVVGIIDAYRTAKHIEASSRSPDMPPKIYVKDPAKAALWSLVFVGGGHFYNGQIFKGFLTTLVGVLFAITGWGLAVTGVIGLVAAINAYKTAKRANELGHPVADWVGFLPGTAGRHPVDAKPSVATTPAPLLAATSSALPEVSQAVGADNRGDHARVVEKRESPEHSPLYTAFKSLYDLHVNAILDAEEFEKEKMRVLVGVVSRSKESLVDFLSAFVPLVNDGLITKDDLQVAKELYRERLATRG